MLNRCVPVKETTVDQQILCSKPNCEEAGKPCFTEYNEDQKYWHLDHGKEGECIQEAAMQVMVVFQAPNSGPFTDLLATYVSGFNECMTAITENMVMILAWGV